MKLQWNRSLRISLCTAAILSASWAQAQMPSQSTLPAPAHSGAEAPMHPQHQHRPHHQGDGHKHPGKKAHHHKHKASSGKYATPQQHEAAAVGQERRQGVGPSNPGMNDYQRNALRRCEVFKNNDDRMACVERVRQPQVSGSVSGGGVLREYTQTIQVPTPVHHAPPSHHMQPAPAHPHMVHPPVQPIRPQ